MRELIDSKILNLRIDTAASRDEKRGWVRRDVIDTASAAAHPNITKAVSGRLCTTIRQKRVVFDPHVFWFHFFFHMLSLAIF